MKELRLKIKWCIQWNPVWLKTHPEDEERCRNELEQWQTSLQVLERLTQCTFPTS